MEVHKDEQPIQDTSKLTYGEKFYQEWKASPYNLDRIGQVVVKTSFKPPEEIETNSETQIDNQVYGKDRRGSRADPARRGSVFEKIKGDEARSQQGGGKFHNLTEEAIRRV